MGSRHNRKRTRSRPRHRNSRRQQLQSPTLPQFQQTPLSSPLAPRPPNCFGPPTVQQLQQLRVQAQERAEKQRQHYIAAMEAERMRMFGGVVGDEVELCGKMLGVVMDLFGGNVDYEDP